MTIIEVTGTLKKDSEFFVEDDTGRTYKVHYQDITDLKLNYPDKNGKRVKAKSDDSISPPIQFDAWCIPGSLEFAES